MWSSCATKPPAGSAESQHVRPYLAVICFTQCKISLTRLSKQSCACFCCRHVCERPRKHDRSHNAVQAFFADIYAEARKAKPGPGHMALAQIAGANKLLRHYTMNIDGLAETAGMDAWHVENNPTGVYCLQHV